MSGVGTGDSWAAPGELLGYSRGLLEGSWKASEVSKDYCSGLLSGTPVRDSCTDSGSEDTTEECAEERTEECSNTCTEERTEERTEKCTEERTDECTDS